jgi:hypothetical protein
MTTRRATATAKAKAKATATATAKANTGILRFAQNDKAFFGFCVRFWLFGWMIDRKRLSGYGDGKRD